MDALPVVYTVDELAAVWKCSSRFVYDLLRQGRLAGFRIGSSWRVSEESRLAYERGAAMTQKPQKSIFVH